MSKIQWTEHTWNPTTGCSRKSSGCGNCYAETLTKRLGAMGLKKYQGLLNEQDRFNGVIKFDEKTLLKPLKRKKPAVYFVNSMSDLFHENVKTEWIDKIFAVMALCPQHIFQVLTKRPERMRDYLLKNQANWGDLGVSETTRYMDEIHEFIYKQRGNGLNEHLEKAGWWQDYDYTPEGKSEAGHIYYNGKIPLPNVWLIVSIEDQPTADYRIPILLDTPAAVRGVSAEPLLEAIDFRAWFAGFSIDVPDLNWVIVGGESGANVRPCNEEHIRSIVKQCKRYGVKVFVKQMGKESYYKGVKQTNYSDSKGGDIEEFPTDLQIREYPEAG